MSEVGQYTRWVIVQVDANVLCSMPPITGDQQVYVAPTVPLAVRALSRGELVAMPTIAGQMDALLTALRNAGVLV